MAAAPSDQTVVRLEAIADAIGDALITTDLDSVVTSWNVGAERLYGYARADVVGRSILTIFPPGRDAEEQDIIARIRRGESVRELDAIRRRSDGALVQVSLTVSPIANGSGPPIGTVRIARDLSESDRVYRAGRRLAAIVESSDDAIISKDLDGVVTSWNLAAERMFGYSATEMIGRSIRTLIPDDRQTEEDEVLRRIRGGDKVDHFETIRRRKDGSLVPISLTVSPILDGDGRVIGASKIARDISERQHLERERAHALAAAEENAAITEKLNEVGTLVASALDRETVVQAVTDAATALTTAAFGAFFYNAADGRGEPYTLYTVSGAPREAFANFPPRNTPLFEPTFHGGGPVRSADISRDPRYGRNDPFRGMPAGNLPVRSYLAIPVRTRAGDVLGALFFGHPDAARFSDRHERLGIGIAAWASIALENARLYIGVQEASRLKDEFLATLSHELRTPLNAILGYARMIRGGILAADRHHKAVDIIERNATSLTQIVEDVLDVSRIISGKMRLNVQPLDIRDIIRNVIETAMPAAEAKGIAVEASLDEPGTLISGDAERLQQVLWNLVSNAVKFTGQGGRVSVRLSRVDGQVHIVVADNGIGIPPAFLPHIFERFRQADSGTNRERGGLGLGLSIARQLVEMHGGTISADSMGSDRGSRFMVSLPITARERTGEPASFRPDRTDGRIDVPDLGGIQVLAVDDDADALAMVREILEAAGAQVLTADSAPAALEILATTRPDVLVADLGMPRMDGFALIARIRQHADPRLRDIRAIALTAYVRSDDRAKALRSGFHSHLGKPIDPADLMAAVLALIQPSA